MQLMRQPERETLDINLNGWRNRVWRYYGEIGQMHEGPQAFLVDLPEKGATVEPHFHDVDQFQVIVRGRGKFGRDPVGPIAFHYADAYTPYGPIVGPEDGISFFTLRAACAGGHFSMPGSRHLMQGKPGRNKGADFNIDRPLPPGGQSVRETLMAEDHDGMKAVGIRMGPNAHAKGEPALAGAQYCVVCSGAVVSDGKEYPRLALFLVDALEPAPAFQAGPQGANVLVLQLPRASERAGSDPKRLAERAVKPYEMPGGTLVKQA